MIPPNPILSNQHKSHFHNHIQLIFWSTPILDLFDLKDSYLSALNY